MVVVTVEQTPRVPAVHGLQLRRALCETLSLSGALRILRPILRSSDLGVNEVDSVGSENAPRRIVQMRSLPSFDLFGSLY